MADYLANFLGHPGQFVALAAVVVVWLGLGAIGGALIGRPRFAEADFVSGWAVAYLLFVLAGVFTPVRFTVLAAGFALAAVAAAALVWRREGNLVPTGTLRMVALAAPLLLLVSGMVASQWDEFSNWLPSGRFLLETDRFPDAAHPQTGASFPAYPYAWPMIAYLVGRLTGHLVEATGPLVNLLLLLSFGRLILRLISHALGENGPMTRPGWALSALGILAVTLANPTFVQKVVLTNYADTPSAVCLGFATVLAWFMLEAQADDDAAEARRLAWQAGLSLVVLVGVKQAAVVPSALLIGGIGLIVMRHPAIGFGQGAALLARVAVPPLIAYAVWRYHVATELSGREFTVRPFSAWAFDLLPTILGAMLSVALKKSLYFGIMILATGWGVRGFVRMASPFDRLAVLVGTLFLGYNAFLLFAYVTAFSDGEASRAASFWRYNMHLGLVAVAFAAFGLAFLWKVRLAGRFDVRQLAWVPIVLVLAAPFAFAGKIRFDRAPPVPFLRAVAEAIRTDVPQGAKVAVIDPEGSGQSAMITRYAGRGWYTLDKFISAFMTTPIEAAVGGTPPPFVLVFSVSPDVRAVLGDGLEAGAAYLLRPDGQGQTWSVVRSWPRKNGG